MPPLDFAQRFPAECAQAQQSPNVSKPYTMKGEKTRKILIERWRVAARLTISVCFEDFRALTTARLVVAAVYKVEPQPQSNRTTTRDQHCKASDHEAHYYDHCWFPGCYGIGFGRGAARTKGQASVSCLGMRSIEIAKESSLDSPTTWSVISTPITLVRILTMRWH